MYVECLLHMHTIRKLASLQVYTHIQTPLSDVLFTLLHMQTVRNLESMQFHTHQQH